MKKDDIVRCTNGCEYRVNYVEEKIVGLTYVYWHDGFERYIASEYCTYDTPIEYVKEIVCEA